MRYLFLVVVLAASLVAGLWFRGAEDHSVSPPAVIVLSLCVLMADLLGPPKSRKGRMGAALLSGVLFAAGWYLGGRELNAALDHGARNSETVRVALEDYRERTGEYPESLDELTGFDLPGRRLLRGTVLQYARTDSGYVLWYRDGANHFSATQDHEMGLERRYE